MYVNNNENDIRHRKQVMKFVKFLCTNVNSALYHTTNSQNLYIDKSMNFTKMANGRYCWQSNKRRTIFAASTLFEHSFIAALFFFSENK